MLSYSELVIGAVAKAEGAVVNISTVKLAQNAFFNTVPVQGMGSGIIIDRNGTILTNHHIIAGASKVAVTLNSGKRFAGT